jgi:hypothetical protein
VHVPGDDRLGLIGRIDPDVEFSSFEELGRDGCNSGDVARLEPLGQS